MKKLSIILAFAALAAGFTSCEEDRDPVYQAPTEFKLNVPQMQDQYIELTDAKSSVLEFTCSQPDYGYSAVTQYSMQMAIDEAFTTTYDLESVSATSAQIQVKQSDVALGLLRAPRHRRRRSLRRRLRQRPDGQNLLPRRSSAHRRRKLADYI